MKIMKISRRSTLKWLAAASVSGPAYYAFPQQAATPPLARGYGTDPDMLLPIVPWRRTMNLHQLQMAAVLADLILPGTENAPAPSALGIQDFVDEWVSAPYPRQQADRGAILSGFNWIDSEANRLRQRSFLRLEVTLQEEILNTMIPKDIRSATTVQENFFLRFRYVVVGAYYTTPEGLKDIGYLGNVALPSYPPVTEHELKILDAELRKLGVTD